MNLANEGFEAKRKEEEVAAKKRKADDEANWERAYSPHLYLLASIFLTN